MAGKTKADGERIEQLERELNLPRDESRGF